MLPYSRGLILDNTNNYGIVKTETVFGFAPKSNNIINHTFNSSEPLEWIFTHGNFRSRSLTEPFTSFNEARSRKEVINDSTKTIAVEKTSKDNTKTKRKKQKNKSHRRPKKSKKCIFKVINKKGKKNTGSKYKMQKKYVLPLILGLLAAKSFLIPIALKALAFLSAKGLMMGFFSTVLASVLSLKGMFDQSHYYGYQNRKDDTKTQVEIIQVPSKSEDHVYYDDHYHRGDTIPEILSKMGYEERMALPHKVYKV